MSEDLTDAMNAAVQQVYDATQADAERVKKMRRRIEGGGIPLGLTGLRPVKPVELKLDAGVVFQNIDVEQLRNFVK